MRIFLSTTQKIAMLSGNDCDVFSGSQDGTEHAQCNFPSWFTQREWTDLEANHIYRHDLTSDTLVVDRQFNDVVRYTDTSQRHICQTLEAETYTETRYITKVTDEW